MECTAAPTLAHRDAAGGAIHTINGAFDGSLLDGWSRRIVGWAFGHDLKARLVLDALDMAIAARKPKDVIHHSDKGSQYTSWAFGHRCQAAGVRPSTGTAGDVGSRAGDARRMDRAVGRARGALPPPAHRLRRALRGRGSCWEGRLVPDTPGPRRVETAFGPLVAACQGSEGRTVWLSWRPEAARPGDGPLAGRVVHCAFQGAHTDPAIEAGGAACRVQVARADLREGETLRFAVSFEDVTVPEDVP